MRRPTLRLTLECNNACVFCAQRGLKAAGVDAFGEHLRVLRTTADEVTFLGGEPTLVPELPELIRTARALGFRGVGLQTNGRRLADKAYVATLADAGLTDLHFSIHGADAATHDYHVGVPGAFAELVAGAGLARARAITMVATTVLTRSNYRVLPSIPFLLKATGFAAWLVTLPRVAGAIAPATDRVSPRLGLALPLVRAAFAEAEKIRLESWISGAPACLLGPLTARLLPDEPRSYAAVCESCPSRSFCPGVEAAYLKQFKADELAAKTSPTPAKPTPITRLFVGVGELAPSVAPEPSILAPDVTVTQLGISKDA